MRQRSISRGLRGGRAPLVFSIFVTAAACTGGGDGVWWQPPDRSTPDDTDRGRARSGGSGQALEPSTRPGAFPPPSPSPAPDFGPTVTLDRAPPSLGGASLVVSDDGTTAIATDTDRDRVAIVNLDTKETRIVALAAGDEPGRLVLDGANRVHVVLDRAGEVATIDLASASVVTRRAVCAAPRGIARNETTLFVACTGGEIVMMPADPAGKPELLARIDRDLRDIVAVGADLLVSRLRTAEVLRVRRSDGAVVARAARSPEKNTEPSVGWRLVASGLGGAVLVHQMARTDTIDVAQAGAYGAPPGNPCGGLAVTAVTSFTPNDGGLTVEPHASASQAVVPVDIARAHAGGPWNVIAAGNSHIKALAKIQTVPLSASAPGTCETATEQDAPGADPEGHAVALAFTPSDALVVFSREPAAIHVRANTPKSTWATIPLGGESVEDTGHAIFHSNTGKGIACVSCHPGGGDDGRVWKFSDGIRRTQTLEGTLDGTAPYHWGGDMDGIENFGGPVFGKRMGGPHLDYARLDALRAYLTRLPAARISPPTDAAAAARGKALFESAAVGCSGCHDGAKLTNNESVDVGTGAAFQVPSLLGLALRAPYLHDGRAKTLLDRFGPAGGDDHGQTSTLTPAEVSDLIVYLESL